MQSEFIKNKLLLFDEKFKKHKGYSTIQDKLGYGKTKSLGWGYALKEKAVKKFIEEALSEYKAKVIEEVEKEQQTWAKQSIGWGAIRHVKEIITKL